MTTNIEKEETSIQGAWTVIFLFDNLSNPKNIILLKRAEWKKFAPNLYTGIGGTIEQNEKPIDNAYREMMEETGIETNLKPFAEAIIPEEGRLIYYFVGEYSQQELPECNEGTLERVNINTLVNRDDIISTTHEVIKEWASKNFSLNSQFTIELKRTDKENNPLLCKKTDIQSELLFDTQEPVIF